MSLERELNGMKANVQRTGLISLAVIALLLVGVAAWGGTQEVEEAVIAPGTIVVGSQKKRVQHPDGGIVAAINVNDGDHVAAGAILFRLDGKLLVTERGAVRRRIFELSAKRWRLLAERDGADELPPWHTPPNSITQVDNTELDEIIVGQRRLFEIRRLVVAKQKDQLAERAKQLDLSIGGLERQITSRATQLAVTRDEISQVSGLKKRGLLPLSRWTPMARQEASLDGELGQIEAQLASTRAQIAEVELKRLEVDETYRREALNDLQAVDGELSQLVEKHTALEEKVGRLDVRAPVAGRIHELGIHTIGGVVTPSDTLAYVVPSNEALVIDALVSPREIDRVHEGGATRVRLTSFDSKTTPELFGHIVSISADHLAQKENLPPAFKVRVALNDGEVARLGRVDILPGMEAEVMMTSAPRTMLSYLAKPMVDQMTRAFRER